VLATTRHITLGIARAGYQEALNAERPKHEAWVDRIQHLAKPAINRVALRSAAAIARGDAPYRNARTPSEIARGLQALQNAGFITSAGHSQGWRLVDPLFSDYLSRLDMTGPLARGL
jgi:hypothetical protein